MSTEDTLANIPTDQLILKLLQELVTRVDKLEKKDQAAPVQVHSARESPGSNSQDSSDIAIHQPNTTEPGAGAAEAEDGGSFCRTCGKIPGDLCHCIDVPYGHLLDNEIPSGNMSTVEERVSDLERSEEGRDHLSTLKGFDIAAVPADGRLRFRNFWSPTTSSDLEQAKKCFSEIYENGGCFSVRDFDCHGGYMAYGPGCDVVGRWGRTERDLFRKFRVPFIRYDHERPYTTPWNRLIILAGLNVLTTPQPFFEYSIYSMWTFDAHLKPYPSFSGLRTYPLAPIGTNIRLFHLYGYEVSSERHSDRTIWKHGALPGKKKWLLQRAYTLSSIYHESNPFWTLVFLLPPQRSRARAVESQLQTRICKNMPLAIVMAEAAFCILESMWKGWTTLIAYIDELLRTGDEIFDLEAHDILIFDDDLYTRSRRYFWAINCINESMNLLQRNLQAWTKHREGILPLGRELPSAELRKEFDNSIEKCDEVLARLMEVKESFTEQRTKAVALRDGLFSASVVMESRASTRLGENVKLLTYVSIFYLPLAFCTSIWSTTDTFGYRNLVITMVAIGLLTYLVVFNLNLLVSHSKTSYSSLKINVISSMQADSRKGWGERGELFHKYRSREAADQSEPSEWWILVYLLQRTLDVLSFRRKDASEEWPQKSERKWYMRLWWGAEKRGRNSGPRIDDTSDPQA